MNAEMQFFDLFVSGRDEEVEALQEGYTAAQTKFSLRRSLPASHAVSSATWPGAVG